MSLFFYLFHEVLFFHQNNHKSELKGKKRLHTINHLRSVSYKYKNTIRRMLYNICVLLTRICSSCWGPDSGILADYLLKLYL